MIAVCKIWLPSAGYRVWNNVTVSLELASTLSACVVAIDALRWVWGNACLGRCKINKCPSNGSVYEIILCLQCIYSYVRTSKLVYNYLYSRTSLIWIPSDGRKCQLMKCISWFRKCNVHKLGVWDSEMCHIYSYFRVSWIRGSTVML